MEFNENIIKRIEVAMGFKLYKWQKNYLLNDFNINPNYRCAGNTTIYAIKKLLTLKEVIEVDSNDISKLCDYDPSGNGSLDWFKDDVKNINERLLSAGFMTCLRTNKEPALEITLSHVLDKIKIKMSGRIFDYERVDYLKLDNGPLIVLKPDKYKLVPVEELHQKNKFW